VSRSRLILFILGPVAVGSAIVAAGQRPAPQFPQPTPTTSAPATSPAASVPQRVRWEYHVETARVYPGLWNSPPDFNGLGQDGWELCGVRTFTNQENDRPIEVTEFYFKRPF
jgi:hypothetical protein